MVKRRRTPRLAPSSTTDSGVCSFSADAISRPPGPIRTA
jgi:hypothetical protein